MLWGRQGEALKQYLTKGRQISVQGELRQNRWEQNGQSHSTVEIYANNVELLSGSRNGSSDSNYNSNSAPRSSETKNPQPQPQVPAGPEDFEDDDIPF